MVQIKTFSIRLNTGESSQYQADILNTKVNSFLTENNISFSDVKRFDITPITQNGNISSGGANTSFHSHDSDVFLIYTLMIEKGTPGNL